MCKVERNLMNGAQLKNNPELNRLTESSSSPVLLHREEEPVKKKTSLPVLQPRRTGKEEFKNVG